MYVNAAYWNHHLPAVEDKSRPLIVTSCGNYRVRTRPVVETKRPVGRSDYQLLYIASGKGHFFIDGAEQLAAAGSIILYQPNEPQHYIYYKEDRTDVYWIHFTGSDVDTILEYYNVPVKNNMLYIGTSPDLAWLFGQIIQELQLCQHRYEEVITLQLRNLLLLISRSLESSNSFSNATEQEAAMAMHYFKEHYNQEISIEAYAASRNLSTGWFIHCFRQRTGQTPLQYLLALRISNAQSLLENTDDPISEIAAQVGYENALYFSRLFHKQTGMSPKAYRKTSWMKQQQCRAL